MKTIFTFRYFATILFVVFLSQQTFAANIIVTNNNNAGIGSLRQAIYNAADGDSISFSNAFTIYLDSTINLGSKTIIINGQVGNTKVRLNGNYYDDDNDTIDDDGIMCRPLTIISTGNNNVTLYSLIIENGNTEYINNNVYSKYGGGMYVDMSEGGKLLVQNCIIQNNTLTNLIDVEPQGIYLMGGGIFVKYGGEFINCTIRNNKIITRNKFTNTSLLGGGICTQDNSNASFTYCTIVGNAIIENNSNASPIIWGGGICLLDNALISNSIIIGNSVVSVSFSWGGGIFTKNAELTNCVITENFNNEGIGGGVSNHGTNMQNCIIINNNASEANNTAIFGIGATWGPQYTAISDSADFIPDLHMIVLHENPFREAPSAGPDQIWGTDDDIYGDLRLVENSPCINAGNPDTTTFTLLSKDFYNTARIVNDTIDMGVAEYFIPQITYYLKGTAYSGSTKLTSGTVYVINTNLPHQKIDSCYIQPDGTYIFQTLLPNSYYLLVVPEDSNSEYTSTYFGNVTNINEAIPIQVNTNIISVDITVIHSTTSVEHLTKNMIDVFPNPAHESIRINMEYDIALVSIINILSETVFSEHYRTGESIYIKNLPIGIYIVKVMFENGEYSYSRIVKK